MSEQVEVLLTLPFPEDLVNQIRGVSPRLNVSVHPASEPKDVPSELWEKAEVLYTHHVLPSPEQAPHLEWVQFHWAGIEHALDAPVLKKPEVVATHLSGASVSQMGEYAVMMMLALGHRLHDAMSYQKRPEWPKGRWDKFVPVELRGSTVGIVGYGSVGRQIARLLQVFGATVLATKRDAMHPEDDGYIIEDLGDPKGELVHRLYPSQALRSMLKECDFVVVTVPLTAETRGLIAAEALGALKPSAYLIDISRGGVIDHEALIPALREKKIAGAALDVFPTEPLPPESPLWKLPNVIITPHIAGFSPQYDQRATDLFCENLHRYLAGLPLYNRIKLDRGY
jgi:phosphoglycerate dehydrogenase-like enzyme